MILDFCKLPPRPQQIEALSWLEEKWNQVDVFVLVAPTASGKSMLSYTIAKWQESLGYKTTIITPTHMLKHQYLKDYPDLVTNKLGVPKAAHSFLTEAPCRIMDYYSYLSHRNYTSNLVIDEAHNIGKVLTNSITLWHHLYLTMPETKSIYEILKWLDPLVQGMKGQELGADDKRLVKFHKQLQRSPESYSLEVDFAEYRGKPRKYLRLTKLSPRDEKPILWPSHRVRKLVLMSATFSEEDLWDLGLETRRVAVLEVGSPIPVEQRPVLYTPVGSLAFASQEETLPSLVGFLETKLNQFPTKGIIHVTYAMAEKLRARFKHDRVVYHTKLNKEAVYQSWLRSPPHLGQVLVGAGMTEGLDLKGDLARWQVITKVNFPSLADIAVFTKMQYRPRAYTWTAIREVIQATGRVCRDPTDSGVTYIVDSSFGRLYNQNCDMFPKYFKEALI